MNEEEWGFDYKWLGGCEFGVFSSGTPDYTADCGEPAIAYGWWSKDESGGMRLCQKHLQIILDEKEEAVP